MFPFDMQRSEPLTQQPLNAAPGGAIVSRRQLWVIRTVRTVSGEDACSRHGEQNQCGECSEYVGTVRTVGTVDTVCPASIRSIDGDVYGEQSMYNG